MAYKGILFDFDGVVVKSMEQHFIAWKKAFAEKGVQITADEFFIMEGQGISTISHKIGSNHGLSPVEVEQVKSRKVNFYNQYMTIEFYDYFEDLLRNLNRRNIRKGIVTGGTRERVIQIVDKYFDNEFACVVTSDDVENGKPHPEPFLKGAELLNLKPKECVVVENAPLGIQGAKEAGMTVIAVTTTLTEEFLKQADYISNDFREVKSRLNTLFSPKSR